MVNHTTMQGRFTADPNLEKKGGFDYCEFTIAWSEKYKEKETKCFLRCKAWRSKATNVAKYFKKGQECVVEGRLVTEFWDDENGKQKSRIVMSLEEIHFAGSKSKGSAADSSNKPDDDFVNVPEDGKEELPFN